MMPRMSSGFAKSPCGASTRARGDRTPRARFHCTREHAPGPAWRASPSFGASCRGSPSAAAASAACLPAALRRSLPARQTHLVARARAQVRVCARACTDTCNRAWGAKRAVQGHLTGTHRTGSPPARRRSRRAAARTGWGAASRMARARRERRAQRRLRRPCRRCRLHAPPATVCRRARGRVGGCACTRAGAGALSLASRIVTLRKE